MKKIFLATMIFIMVSAGTALFASAVEDVNKDQSIGWRDCMIVVSACLSEKFIPEADINGDESVNIEDLIAIQIHPEFNKELNEELRKEIDVVLSTGCLPGDTTNDGQVNIEDFVLVSKWCNSKVTAETKRLDQDGDGWIGGLDVKIVGSYYGTVYYDSKETLPGIALSTPARKELVRFAITSLNDSIAITPRNRKIFTWGNAK